MAFPNMGAYTVPIGSPFNGFMLPKIIYFEKSKIWQILNEQKSNKNYAYFLTRIKFIYEIKCYGGLKCSVIFSNQSILAKKRMQSPASNKSISRLLSAIILFNSLTLRILSLLFKDDCRNQTYILLCLKVWISFIWVHSFVVEI